MEYILLKETVNTRGKLIPISDNLDNYIKSNKDYYTSLFIYNQKHYDDFQKSGTISGIKDVTTNILYWDFDSKDDIKRAKDDAVELCSRLISRGISPSDVQIAFSGKKGFSVELHSTERFNEIEIKNITLSLGQDLKTLDTKIYNASRIVRVLGTRHQETGLYKTPLTLNQLSELTVDQIKEIAKSLDNVTEEFNWDIVNLPEGITKLKLISTNAVPALVKPSVVMSVDDIDFSSKPKGFTNCKYAMLNGYLPEGNRNNAIIALAATCKSLGYAQKTTYYMCKSAIKMQAERTGQEEFNKFEMGRAVNQVYKPTWKGGTYSCKDGKTPWLTDLCNSLDGHKCKHEAEKNGYLPVNEIFDRFQDYAENIDKNTIKTGIHSLDDKVRFKIGQMIAVLGAPSSGKTAMALNILENTSRQGLLSVFYSLDMAHSELFQKIVHKVTGYSEEKIFKLFQSRSEETKDILKKVEEAFGNVKFCFDTGVTPEDIHLKIAAFQEERGEKVKLLLVDYNELLSGPFSDATSNSGYIAGKLKAITNHLELCTVVLVQPAKMWGDASDELVSYRAIKGSSLLEQCFSTIIGIYRPGFSPKNDSNDDKFMIMNSLKNRMGKLFSLPFKWSGLKGEISEMTKEDHRDLDDLLERLKEEKATEDDF